jgi:chitinase
MRAKALILAIAALPVVLAGLPRAAPRAAIIAYVFAENDLIDPTAIAADKLTHINYAFANIKDGEVVEGFSRDAENFKLLASLRRAHPELRVLVSVGGWTWSGGFSDAVLTADSRRRFVESAVRFVVRHDLDGFDVDWEYPGLPGLGNPHRPEDRQNFTAVMAQLRDALNTAGREQNRTYLLTFAAGAFADFITHTELDKVQASVDFVNLMTYDFRVAEADPVSGHHANLFPSPADPEQRSVDRAVKEFLAAGVPPGKLVVGVPFYGRGWSDVAADRNGRYQPGKPIQPRMDLNYSHLASDVIGRDGFVRYWDAEAQAPYLWNAERKIFITYEDPESLGRKTLYIREHGLAGAMFWEYNADLSGALLEALHQGLRPR